jgi:hypothetical protein
MNYPRQLTAPARVGLLAALGLVAILSVPKLSKATGAIGKEDLAGPWQIALGGNTGCGSSAMLFNGTLNNAGSGTGTLVGHSTGCGDSVSPGQSFTITSLAPNGSGKATLSCGAGCGWDFTIQVSPDRTTFNLVDVDPANPNNTPAGMAVHQ